MDELYKNNSDLNKVKKNLLVLLGAILLILQISAVQAAPQAIFATQGKENVRTSGNDFYHGTYPAQYGYFVSIQNTPDDSGTVLGNIVYGIDADNIIEYDHMQYAHKEGTSIQWVFPENVSLGENTFIYSNEATDYIYQRYIPITVHRWTNRSVFSSDGYQLASFSVSYDNLSLNDANVTFDHVFGSIATNENSKFNASIVPGSFTTTMPIVNNPMASNNSHRYSFSNSTPIGINQVYNFSVVLHIHLKDPTVTVIEYYPGFYTSLMGGTSSFDPVSRFNATSPSFMLPKYARSANGSTNISNQWYYSFDFSRGVNLNESWTSSNRSITRHKIGVYQNGVWYLDNDGSGTWNAGDTISSFGLPGWSPVVGDWNGDSKTDVGVMNGQQWYLDSNGDGIYDAGDGFCVFGLPGWSPVVGDWNGDGRGTKIGVYKDGTWYLDTNGDGAFGSGDSVYSFGLPGWSPVVGDWNGDSKTDVGVTNGQQWYLDMNNNGIWNAGDRVNNFGLPGWTPIVGDWNGEGRGTKMGVYKDGAWYLDTNGDGAFGSGDSVYTFGLPGWSPVAGKWS